MPRASAMEDPYAPERAAPATAEAPSVAEASPLDPLVPADGNWTRRLMKRFLDAQPQRAVAIPRDPGDKPGQPTFQRVIYQGFNYDVPKGRSVSVPEPIALILDELEEGRLRTAQSKNRAVYLNDIGASDGPEIQVDRAVAR